MMVQVIRDLDPCPQDINVPKAPYNTLYSPNTIVPNLSGLWNEP